MPRIPLASPAYRYCATTLVYRPFTVTERLYHTAIYSFLAGGTAPSYSQLLITGDKSMADDLNTLRAERATLRTSILEIERELGDESRKIGYQTEHGVSVGIARWEPLAQRPR